MAELARNIRQNALKTARVVGKTLRPWVRESTEISQNGWKQEVQVFTLESNQSYSTFQPHPPEKSREHHGSYKALASGQGSQTTCTTRASECSHHITQTPAQYVALSFRTLGLFLSE